MVQHTPYTAGTELLSSDPIIDAAEREKILARIMARDGISRAEAEALLLEADIERLRMRDA